MYHLTISPQLLDCAFFNSENPVLKIIKKFPITPFKIGANLNFYLENAENTEKALSIFNENCSFISISDKKNLIMQKSKTPLPLLHLTKIQNKGTGISSNHFHMWSTPYGSQLHLKLEELGIKPKAHGQVFHHGMNDMNWSLLETAEL